MNIDPTDEDSWTFGTVSSNQTAYYDIFNEDGSLNTQSVGGVTYGGISNALT